MDTRLSGSHQCTLVANANSIVGCIRRSSAGRLREMTGEAMSRVLGTVLGFPAEERCGLTGASSAKGHKDD